MTPQPDVLVVGAGPTGLALALQAHAHGARVRVVERRPEAFRPSRALIVHARTLEVLRPLGVVDALLARTDTAPTARLHVGPDRRCSRRSGTLVPGPTLADQGAPVDNPGHGRSSGRLRRERHPGPDPDRGWH